MPSGPSRLTACFTRSVRPQLSMRKPRSCRNFASVEAASSLREAQTQSSVLKGKKRRTHTAGKACCGSIISEQPDRINVFSFFPGIKYRSGRGKKPLSSVTAGVMFGFYFIYFFYICAYKRIESTHAIIHTYTLCCWNRTGAGGARSPPQAAAAWRPAGRHRCPPRSCVCVPCAPRPPGPTPSAAAAP